MYAADPFASKVGEGMRHRASKEASKAKKQERANEVKRKEKQTVDLKK